MNRDDKLPGATSADELIGKAQPNAEITYLKGIIKKREASISRQQVRIGALEDVSELFGDAIRALPPPQQIDYRIPKGKKVSTIMAHAVITDLHAEETIDPEEMEGYGCYSWSVFLDRMWHTITKCIQIVDLARHSNRVTEISVFLLGDNVTGDIHADGERTASISLPLAIVEIGDIIAQSLNYLSAHFEKVTVVCICGNHGRKDLKPVTKQRADRNWDSSVYHIARKITRDNHRIEWIIPRSPAIIYNAPGVDFLLKHGDGIMSSGTTPYYGIVRDTAREQSKRRKEGGFDYVIQGHLHHYGLVEGCRIIAPSLIGPNQYSFNLLHATYPAEQLLLFTSAEHGLISQHPIKFTDMSSSHGFLSDELSVRAIG